jgi:protein-disulfide isomerase
LSRIRFFLAFLLAFAAIGCKAQSSPQTASPQNGSPQTGSPQNGSIDQKTIRKVDVLVRSKLNVPAEYQLTVGPRMPSDIPGFDTVKVTFTLPGHTDHAQSLDFLLSKDGNTLARLSRWDIHKDPMDMIPTGDRPARGNPGAKVVIVNFDDLECPYCAKMHSELFPETLEHYKGLVKIVYRDLPLEELHPWAMHAAVNANCLADQSPTAYWSYVDYLHVHGEDVSGPDRNLAKSKATLDKLAKDQGAKSNLDAAKLDACITKQDEQPIRTEMKAADALNIAQTPTLFVNGEMLAGALPPDTLWHIIDRALIAEGITPPPNPLDKPAVQPATPAPPPAKAESAAPGTKP